MCVQLESIEFYFAADRHCSHIVNIHIYKYTLAALMGASSHGRKKKEKKNTYTHNYHKSDKRWRMCSLCGPYQATWHKLTLADDCESAQWNLHLNKSKLLTFNVKLKESTNAKGHNRDQLIISTNTYTLQL